MGWNTGYAGLHSLLLLLKTTSGGGQSKHLLLKTSSCGGQSELLLLKTTSDGGQSGAIWAAIRRPLVPIPDPTPCLLTPP